MRARILEAAGKRFKHYGFAKTSVAEIAGDLQMSPGNLYRYFPGKIDIALAIAEEALECHHAQLAAVAAETKKSASQRLRHLLRLDLSLTFHTVQNDRRFFEMAETIRAERPAWLRECMARDRGLIEAILRDGVAAGEFDVVDPALTAELLQAAMVRFRHPGLWSDPTLPALERECDGILDLLLVGLAGPRGSVRTALANPAPLVDAA